MPVNTETPPVWDAEMLRNPHAAADKRGRVQRMFAAIAPSYDLNNRLHSLWMDQRWRRKAVKLASVKPNDVIADIACGTGDLTMKFAEALLDVSDVEQVVGHVLGIDFTYEMLPLARNKWLGSGNVMEHERDEFFKPEIRRTIQWINGDAMALPLPDQCCDVLSIAFGIRNVVDPAAALNEFFRVLRPGGRLIVLEFSLPTNRILRGLYNFYFRSILPRTATLISGDKTGAYRYLPESVNTFIGRDEMKQLMEKTGFSQITLHPMTMGVCICYRGIKQ